MVHKRSLVKALAVAAFVPAALLAQAQDLAVTVGVTAGPHAQIAEVAVVGVADNLKGQAALAFAVVRDAALVADEVSSKALEADVMKLVDSRLGAVARPSRVIFVTALPKTRSGKLLRRALQAVAEGRDPGDLSTMEDPAALAQVQQRL